MVAPRTAFAALVVSACALLVPASARADEVVVEAKHWAVVKRESGPVSYYSIATEDGQPFIRAQYTPGLKTVVLGYQVPDGDRRRIKKVRWKWRAQALPNGGDECVPGRGDSAAVVYLTWKRGLRYYTLKYVWSGVGQTGRTCDSKRNPFVAQDTIILRSGGPLGAWQSEEIDLASEYRRHFEGGDPDAEVPNFVGIGLMSDGDQTRSPSAADYGSFALVR